MAPWLGPLSAFIAAAGYFYLVHTRVPHRILSRGMHAAGGGTAVTGIVLWSGLPYNAGYLFAVLMLHSIFAVVTAGLLVCVLMNRNTRI